MTSALRPSLRAILGVCVLLLGSAATPGAAPAVAHAAPASAPVTFNVNSTNDIVADFTGEPSFDTCRTAPANTVCTLRAAIMNANRHAGGATIHVPAGTYPLTVLRSGLDGDDNGNLDISNTVTIAGAGPAATFVDGGGIDTVFVIHANAVVTMSSLTIRNGDATHTGGAVFYLGGAGIVNDGRLTLSDGVISRNLARNGGGGLFNSGTGNATLTRVTVEANGVTFGEGGGIYNNGTLALNDSTVDNNSAGSLGGGLFNAGTSMTVFNSTISNNSAKSDGGGIDNEGTASVLHATIAGNLADDDAALGGIGGGVHNGHILQLANSLLADNFVSQTVNECASSITSQEFNLIQTNAGCTVSGDTTGNITNINNALLGELADNGGGTRTRALLAGSRALDQIPATINGPCHDPSGAGPTPDQRGVARPVGPKCDMGAFEGAQPLAAYYRNLVFNGDAEGSAGSPIGAWVGAAGWANDGQFTVVRYNAPGGFPSVPTDTVPANHGLNFFAGTYITQSIGFQLVSLPAISSSINAGAVSFVFSADLGGFGNQDDNASVIARFLDGGLGSLGPDLTLGPFNAAQRGNQTKFLHVAYFGVVPANAVFVNINIKLTRTSGPGTYNDGYADNVSLMLLPKDTLFLPAILR